MEANGGGGKGRERMECKREVGLGCLDTWEWRKIEAEQEGERTKERKKQKKRKSNLGGGLGAAPDG